MFIVSLMLPDAASFQEYFRPGIVAYLLFIAGFCLRYTIFNGGAFVALYLWGSRYWAARKIQKSQPDRTIIRYEVLWSVSNMLCLGLFNMLLYWMIQQDYTRMYFEVAERGWLWLVVSVPVMIIGFDAWFYWNHRMLHTPWFFRHAHRVHHHITNPTPFATFAKHPIETFTEGLYFLFVVMIFPIHPIALAIVGLHAFLMGIFGHMGFEFFPRGFTRHAILGLFNTSTHHNMHHSHNDCHYTLYFTWWDRLMGTLHPDYHRYFDEIKRREE